MFLNCTGSVVHMVYRYILSVCSFHYLVLSELVQYLTLYLSK